MVFILYKKILILKKLMDGATYQLGSFKFAEKLEHKLNKTVFVISNIKTKPSELLLIKYIKILMLFVI